jgi:hypothetical protein
MAKKGSYDFYLILATTVALALISLICVWAMFYFKLAGIHLLEAAGKAAWQERMNAIVSPFIIALLVLLGICVPKRLLPVAWLNRFALLLLVGTLLLGWRFGIRTGLLVILGAALLLQLVVLVLALAGRDYLNFTKKGYWARVGSSLVHLGVVLFVLDLFFYRLPALHLLLFWVTTAATVSGMTCCFYAESIAQLLSRGISGSLRETQGRAEGE